MKKYERRRTALRHAIRLQTLALERCDGQAGDEQLLKLTKTFAASTAAHTVNQTWFIHSPQLECGPKCDSAELADIVP